MVYSRYREGLETRNVLIVGRAESPTRSATTWKSLRHLGSASRASWRSPSTRLNPATLEHHRGLPQLPDPGPLPVRRRDLLLGARGEEAGDRYWWRRRAARYRRPRRARPLRRPGLERSGGVHRTVSHDSAAPARPSRSAPSWSSGARCYRRCLRPAAALAVMLLLIAAVKLDSPGPVFYRAQAHRTQGPHLRLLQVPHHVCRRGQTEGRSRSTGTSATASCSRSPTTRASLASGATCASIRWTNCRSSTTSCAAI